MEVQEENGYKWVYHVNKSYKSNLGVDVAQLHRRKPSRRFGSLRNQPGFYYQASEESVLEWRNRGNLAL